METDLGYSEKPSLKSKQSGLDLNVLQENPDNNTYEKENKSLSILKRHQYFPECISPISYLRMQESVQFLKLHFLIKYLSVQRQVSMCHNVHEKVMRTLV